MQLTEILAVIGCLGYCFFAWKRPGPALILLPLALGAILFAGMVEESIFLLVLSGCMLVLTIAIVRWAPSAGSLETPWHKAFAGIVLMIFRYLLLLAALTFVFHVLGPILFILFVVAVVTFKMAGRYGMALDILSVIGMSMRQSLPLAASLDAAAQNPKNRQGRILARIAYWLTQGWPLSESIRRGYRQCPPELLAAIATAEKMNQLPQAIAHLEADISEKINRMKKVPPVHPTYPIAVLVIAFCIVLGLSIFILPTLSEIVSDTSNGQAQVPVSTQLFLDFAGYMMSRHGLNACRVIIPFVAIILYCLSGSRRRRNPEHLRLLNRMEDWVKWHLPAVHWFERMYSQVRLTEMLRVGLRAGYPLHTTLRNAMGLDVNHCFRGRMQNWAQQVEQGQHAGEAARQCGFEKTLVWAFDDRINKNQTLGILESLEEIYRSRYSYRLTLVNSIGWPFVILGLGLLVGSVVYAMYMGVFHILFVTLQYTMP